MKPERERSSEELASDVSAARTFFSRHLGRKTAPTEQPAVLAAAKRHSHRAVAAQAELDRRKESARTAMREEEGLWQRLIEKYGRRSRSELRRLAEADAAQAQTARQADRAATLATRRAAKAATQPAPVPRPGRPPCGGWEPGAGRALGLLFSSDTLWRLARDRGQRGNLDECLSAVDISTLYFVISRTVEDGTEAFVVASGQRPWPLREADGFRSSVERLCEVGLLTAEQQRGRTEYRLGPLAARIISAAEEGIQLPFGRYEDQSQEEHLNEHAMA